MVRSLQVGKDDYTLRAHVRHEKREVLDKMLDMPLSLGVRLPSPINLDWYTTFAQASVGGTKGGSMTIHPNKIASIFVTAPASNDKQLKGAMIGQYLQGTMTFSKVKKVAIVPTILTYGQ